MKELIAQLGRFGAVGIAATLIHLGVAWIAARVFGAAPFAANALGFSVAFACSYLGHFYWTFGQRSGHPVRLPRFIVVSGFGFALTNLIVWVVVSLGGHAFEFALLAILFAVPLSTWVLSRFWAFR